jgi:shikimate kinase
VRERGRNIVLTGFMATGKTSVGKRLAERLGCEFVDVDTLIEAEAGMPIPQLFSERGEASFRAIEAAMVERVTRGDRCVIATGGGAVVNPRNLALLKDSGTMIALTADPTTILARVGGAADRPMLQGADPRARIEQLLAARGHAYAQADVTVDTSARTVEEVVECIVRRLEDPTRSHPKECQQP